MSKKYYVVKAGNVAKTLTTEMCLGTNDVSKFPVDVNENPVKMRANFDNFHEGKLMYITEDPIEIELITAYLKNTQNPFFYDLDNPTNSRAYYTPEMLK